MEAMLGKTMRPPIRLLTLLADFKDVLEHDEHPRSRADIATAMKLNDDPHRFQEVEENCSLDNLQQFDDLRITSYIPGFTEIHRRTVTQIPHDAFKLKTFKTLLKEKETSIKNPFARTRHSFRAVQQHSAAATASPTAASIESAAFADLLISIRVYRPARATHIGQSIEKPVFAEEFQCLGSNYLTALRDKISCVCKDKRFFEVSELTTDEPVEKLTDPAFFFITDTFYNDKRNAANADYSETIRQWAKTAEGLKHLQFKVAKMEETRFIDLSVSLGFPQLYQHHGNCEHVFVFSQVEIITPDTAICMAPPTQYPLLSSFSTFNNRMCNMCGQRAYVFIVEHSDRQLHDPAYLCNKCFFGFHYIDGKKVGQFKAYKVNDYEDDNEQLAEEEAEGEADVEVTDRTQLDADAESTSQHGSVVDGGTPSQQSESGDVEASETDVEPSPPVVLVEVEKNEKSKNVLKIKKEQHDDV